jgi:hypothetical protein
VKLQFENSNVTGSNIYDLSKGFIPEFGKYKRRNSIQKRYDQDGGVVLGDQKADTRDISLSFQPVADNDTDYIDTINEIIGFFNPDYSPFYLVDTDNDRRCEIVLNDFKDDPDKEGLEFRIGNDKISVEMLGAYWEDVDEIVETSLTGGLDDGETMTIDNDSYFDAYPVITVTPYETNTDFTIKNNTTGAQFTLGSSSFVPGAEFEIDCKNGTIYLTIGDSRTEMSSALADGGGFIKLAPGENEIEYNSVFGACDITISYRRRYVF